MPHAIEMKDGKILTPFGIREKVDALDTLLHDTRLNRARMQGAVKIIRQMIHREL